MAASERDILENTIREAQLQINKIVKEGRNLSDLDRLNKAIENAQEQLNRLNQQQSGVQISSWDTCFG